MATDWMSLLDKAKGYETNMVPGLMEDINKQNIGERKRQRKSQAQRGLLGTGFGAATMADITQGQNRQVEQMQNELGLQGANREVDIAKFLAGLEESEKNRALQGSQYDSQLAWEKEKYEKSKPNWYDYLLGGLQGIGGGTGIASIIKLLGG